MFTCGAEQITERVCSRTSRSSANPPLVQPFTRTHFSRHAFRFSASSVWNSLPQTVLISDSLSIFTSTLKNFLFTQAFTEHRSDLPPAPLKLRPYGAISILSCSVFTQKQFFFALVLPNLNRSGYNFAHTYCYTEYTCGPTYTAIGAWPNENDCFL